MQHTHTSIQTHTHTHTRAVPHTHVRCRCGGRHTSEASLITTTMPSQHLPHSLPRCRVWREEQAASAWASAVQATCPSAPSSMSSLPAAPAPPMCTHTPTHTHQSLHTCRTHIPKHAQHATAGRQAASCSPHLPPFRAPLSLSQPPMHNFRSLAGAKPSAASARSLPPHSSQLHTATRPQHHAPCTLSRTRLSYREGSARRGRRSWPRPALPAQQGPRRSCHNLPHHTSSAHAEG